MSESNLMSIKDKDFGFKQSWSVLIPLYISRPKRYQSKIIIGVTFQASKDQGAPVVDQESGRKAEQCRIGSTKYVGDCVTINN